jgi:lysine-N-methylase
MKPMKNKKRIVLQPDYMKNFKCIGKSCEDSCCVGWNVHIDKETYYKYKKVQLEELKFSFVKMVNRKHNQKSDASYAKVKMKADGRCPFLNEQNLCKIQGTLGETYLSDTCALFPRLLYVIDKKYERSATMSCPEIARLALLNPNGICFEHIEENAEIKVKADGFFDTVGHQYLNRPERYFWDIRIFSLSLLQNRSYTIAERLIILGIVYKKIEEVHINKQTADIPIILENMDKIIHDGILKEELERVPANIQIQMKLAIELTNKKVQKGTTSKRYIKCLEEALTGIDCIDKVNYEIMIQKYEHNYKEYLIPYLNEKEFILENYLVNEYFREQMPFGSFRSIWDSYILLCVLYGMIKLHLIGMAGYHKGLNDDLALRFVQSFSKVVMHDKSYIQGIIKLVKENDYDSLTHMAMLVKN